MKNLDDMNRALRKMKLSMDKVRAKYAKQAKSRKTRSAQESAGPPQRRDAPR